MRGLKIIKQVEISFDADQWELFDEKGRDAAAKALNKALQDAINAPNSSMGDVHAAMDKVFARYAHLGADDGEARYQANLVTRQIYREDY